MGEFNIHAGRWKIMNTYIEYYNDLGIRQLVHGDAAAVSELQSCIYDSMPDKSQFVLTTAEELAESIEHDFCLGAFDEDNLAAVTTIVLNRVTKRNIGYVLGYNAYECVTYDTTFVRPDCRGRGLQRHFMKLKDEFSLKNGAKYAFATVSPDNGYSLNNLKMSGFDIIDRREIYGGVDRFILRKNLRGS
jgi:ribosomal protein S18 acetylase RimI-like enzyme